MSANPNLNPEQFSVISAREKANANEHFTDMALGGEAPGIGSVLKMAASDYRDRKATKPPKSVAVQDRAYSGQMLKNAIRHKVTGKLPKGSR